MRPAELRAFPLEQGGPGENGVLDFVRERIELGLERVKNSTTHAMLLYSPNYIVSRLYSRGWGGRSEACGRPGDRQRGWSRGQRLAGPPDGDRRSVIWRARSCVEKEWRGTWEQR